MKCENCGNKHDGKYGSGRFCNKECARGFSTKSNREEISKKVSIALGGKGILKTKNKICLQCKKQLNKNQQKRKQKFCCNDCSVIFRKEQLYKKWEQEQKFPTQVSARTYLLYKNGNKCEICKETEWTGKPIPLVMDHIDGNSDNHSFDNCRLICRNCDGLLDTYCKKNKGNGASRNKKKLQRYHNGESY